jgi:hypothetical protein
MGPAGSEDRSQMLERYRAKAIAASKTAEVSFIERNFMECRGQLRCTGIPPRWMNS